MTNERTTRVDRLNRLRSEIDDLCSRTKVPEPGVFLASIMAGKDPRPRPSLLFRTVQAIQERGGKPTPDDWSFISDLILESGLYVPEPVPLEQSIKAAERLIEFLHAKLKAVELDVSGSMTIAVAPLSDDEIERFRRVWSENF